MTLEAYTTDNLGGSASITISNFVLTLPTPTVTWYSASTGGTNLGSGDTLIVKPLVAGNDTVFAEANSSDGCVSASRYPVIITVRPWATFTQSPILCFGQSVTVGTHTYSAQGSYIDTLFSASVNGCDSVVTTNLTINPFATYTQNPAICQGQTFIENGHPYTTANMYIDTFFNASVNGCDSIVTTNLTILTPATYTQNPIICSGGSFIENGHTYNTPNTYIDTFKNAGVNGCDSIVTTNLTVLPVSTYTQNPTICQNGSFVENGHTYTATNTYIDTFVNASVNGCDSVVTTNLTVLPLATFTQNPVICQNGSFIEN